MCEAIIFFKQFQFFFQKNCNFSKKHLLNPSMMSNYKKQDGAPASNLSASQPQDEDSLLMLEVSRGSDHAFRMLVEKWKNPLINFFYRSVSNAASAEDLAQQTFINLYKARNYYEVRAKFSTYLFKIARNVLINDYRKSMRAPAMCELNDRIDSPADPDRRLEINEIEEVFMRATEALPENQRTAILLYKQQQLSYEEIAQTMNSSVGAVKTWIHRARQSLKEALERSGLYE